MFRTISCHQNVTTTLIPSVSHCKGCRKMKGAKGRSVIKNPGAPSCLLGPGDRSGAGAAAKCPRPWQRHGHPEVRDRPPPASARPHPGSAHRSASRFWNCFISPKQKINPFIFIHDHDSPGRICQRIPPFNVYCSRSSGAEQS